MPRSSKKTAVPQAESSISELLEIARTCIAAGEESLTDKRKAFDPKRALPEVMVVTVFFGEKCPTT
jgi:hypothetical protein